MEKDAKATDGEAETKAKEKNEAVTELGDSQDKEKIEAVTNLGGSHQDGHKGGGKTKKKTEVGRELQVRTTTGGDRRAREGRGM